MSIKSGEAHPTYLKDDPMPLKRVLPLIVLVTAACPGSTRTGTTVTQPVAGQATAITCVQPPPTVMTTGVDASVTAQIPRVAEILKGNLSYERKVQEIRKESMGIQDFEVMDYRLCMAVASNILDRSVYADFVKRIYPQIVIGGQVTTDGGSPATAELPGYADGVAAGRAAGQAVRGIVNLLEQYKRENGSYPASLDAIQAQELVAFLGSTRLRYSKDEARGFELRFAYFDGQLDTPDDKLHYGTP